MIRAWHHAPTHKLLVSGAYMVTAGTYRKDHHLRSAARLEGFVASLTAQAQRFGWVLQAWSVFSNHYHFIGVSPGSAATLPAMLNQLHSDSADAWNLEDGARGRQVWFNYWETALTFEKSYLARLNYVNQNPVKHGLVRVASHYPWSSAAWFETAAPKSFVNTVSSFPIDRVNVRDPFDPIAVEASP